MDVKKHRNLSLSLLYFIATFEGVYLHVLETHLPISYFVVLCVGVSVHFFLAALSSWVHTELLTELRILHPSHKILLWFKALILNHFF